MRRDYEMQLFPNCDGLYDTRDVVRFVTASVGGSLEMQENLAQWVLSMEDDSCSGIYDGSDGQLLALLAPGRLLQKILRGLWRVAQSYTPHKIMFIDVDINRMYTDLEVWAIMAVRKLS